jgi:hypothetical protein
MSNRRTPTPEQKAKAEARRNQFRELTKKVAAMSEAERMQLFERCGAIVTCEGRALSPVNSCLILSQCGTASMVGGFWQWKRNGRRVMKGQTGLGLWIPTSGKGGEDLPTAEARQVERESGAEVKTGGRRRFIVGTVFDISQTEEEPGALETAGQVRTSEAEALELAEVAQ